MWVIYEITCDQDTTHMYIGETKRPVRRHFKEHTNLTIPTSVEHHCNATKHSVSYDNTKVITRELLWTKWKVKEAIYITIYDPPTGIPTSCPRSTTSSSFPASQNIMWPRLLAEKSKHCDWISKIDPKWVTIASLSTHIFSLSRQSMIWIHHSPESLYQGIS